jgi:nucleotide-binding universal stress UspA family protein
MMTDHIRDQLRGLIIALFAPLFFAVAGLSVDLTILKDPHKLELAGGLILIASLGKLGGCFTGGRLGGLSNREAVALAVGMNARGTTEVIVATIGLSIGVLTKDFYTLIVVMAVSTTMVMPPMLRWALGRIPITGEEKERLEREEAEAKDFVPHVERLLIAVDNSANGRLAAFLGGLFVGTRKIISTVLDLEPEEKKPAVQAILSDEIVSRVKLAIDHAGSRASKKDKQTQPEESAPPAQLTSQVSNEKPEVAILKEANNGYELIFVGVEDGLVLRGKSPGTLVSSVEKIIREIEGVVAIAVAKGESNFQDARQRLKMLVPTTGSDYSRVAAEVAIAIAKGYEGDITVMNVSPPRSSAPAAASKHLRPGRELLNDIKTLGEREGVAVKTVAEVRRSPELAILDQIKKDEHNLVVVGANLRRGEELFLGHSVKALIQRAPCSLLIVRS